MIEWTRGLQQKTVTTVSKRCVRHLEDDAAHKRAPDQHSVVWTMNDGGGRRHRLEPKI